MALFLCASASLMPVVAQGDTEQIAVPPVGQELVREGDFAVRLVEVLNLGATVDEAGAESRLADVGIMPHNGWMADYPMTPDIIGEIYIAVHAAAENGKIAFRKDQALERLNDMMAQIGLPISANPAKPEQNEPPYPTGNSIEYSPSPDVINDYYYNDGPPVVTYYSPPNDYSYMYSWVPYPFWYVGFWYPGYFILNDFHRSAFAGRHGFFVSNHFRDSRGNWHGRIRPQNRVPEGAWPSRGVRTSNGTLPPAFAGHNRDSGSASLPRTTSGNHVGISGKHRNTPFTGSRITRAPVQHSTGTVSSASVSSRNWSYSTPAPVYRSSASTASSPVFNAPVNRSGGFSSGYSHGNGTGGMSSRSSGFSGGFSGRGRR